jgi:lycopene cyclase domain-containing protein
MMLHDFLIKINYFKNTAIQLNFLIPALIFIFRGLYFIFKVRWYERFVFAYLVALIPFLIVNGILTGMFTENPVVWYNESHIMGIRIGTIPFEDLYYNYCLFLPIIGLYEWIKNRSAKTNEHK